MENIYRLVLEKYSKYALFFIIVTISFFLYNIKYFQIDASSDTLILEQDKDLKKFRDVIDDYSSSDFLIVTFTDNEKILSKPNLTIIGTFINKLNEFSWVEEVQSIFDVPLFTVNNQTLIDLLNEVPTLEDEDIDISLAEAEIQKSEIFKDLIISSDLTSTAILVNFKRDLKYEALQKERFNLSYAKNLSSEEIENKKYINDLYNQQKQIFDALRHQNLIEIRELISSFDDSGLKLHLGGISMIADDTISFVKNDIIFFGLGALIFILILLYLVFRSPLWMLFCVANCFAALTIMTGLVSLLGWKVTVISSNFIMLMLILTLSMTVHIAVRYKQALAEKLNLNKIESIIFTVKKMYKPCLYSALTTVFAFLTLYLSGIKPVMDFGLMMCVGLIVAYCTSFIFLPIMMMVLSLDPNNFSKEINSNKIFVSISSNYKQLTIIIFSSLFILGIIGSTFLKVENSFVDYFKKDTEIYKGMKLIDEKLGGTTPLDIIIEFDTNTTEAENFDDEDLLDFGIAYDPTDYWFTKEKIDLIKNIHDHLETYNFAGKVLSLASVIRVAESLNSGNEFDSLELAVLYKKLPTKLKDQILKPYVQIEKNQARITMRLIDTHPDLKRSDFVNDLNDYFTENINTDNINAYSTGVLILYNNMLESLFDSQIKSLGIVLIGIFVMLVFLFKSLSIAIIAIIPNIIACFVILGTMGYLGIPLDLMTITIAAITIGIAIDNSIHYVYRYQEFRSNNNSSIEAMVNSSKTVGMAIRNTSLTIIFGFSILIFSNFYPTIYFGIFTALAMFIAMIGSLTLLPIMLQFLKKDI
tara:strand:+ start:3030 stop:5465 length:2436 start_codon:yes stop_codon:yes gene_type:complete